MTKTFEAVPFVEFKKALQAQFEVLKTLGALYMSSISKEEIYDLYLESFPEGTNVMFKERREYDCNCCKSFIRSAGRAVAIHNNKLVTLWDIKIGGYYQVVADAMKARLEASVIADRFFHFEAQAGTDRNVVANKDGTTTTWNHFFVKLPASTVMTGESIPTALGKYRTQKEVLLRALTEFTLDSGETVSELIAQNSLYRGDEQRSTVEVFIRQKKAFAKLTTDAERDNFAWKLAESMGESAKFKNHAIGTLLGDLSGGMELEEAVKRWEKVVAPANYKRPTALVTAGMVKKAQEAIVALGLEDSLARRFAVAEDLTINNVLFADRSVKQAMNVFDNLATAPAKPKSLDKVEEMNIEDFIANVLPKVNSIELFTENSHSGNLMSLIGPVNKDAPNMLKWDNNFCWSYNGEVTDSIKERVKSAGGNVDGELRISLSWHNGDDLDLHVYEPSGDHLYFGNRSQRSRNGGMLDVDMNAGGPRNPVDPVENIIYPHGKAAANGTYKVLVNNYSKRDTQNPEGFEVEVEYKGKTYTLTQRVNPRNGSTVDVVEFTIQNGQLALGKNIGCTEQSKDIWGIKTEDFQKVAMVLNSPNHWDGQTNGNKHYFFILEGCKNPAGTRGFYNEYLRDDLVQDHRKVFEVLSGKLKAEHTDRQLSGLGFSSTQRNAVLVKVSGTFNRVLKLKF